MAELGQVTHTFTVGEGDEQREYELVGIGPIKWVMDAIRFMSAQAELMGCLLDSTDIALISRDVMPEHFKHLNQIDFGEGVHALETSGALSEGRDYRLVRRKMV